MTSQSTILERVMPRILQTNTARNPLEIKMYVAKIVSYSILYSTNGRVNLYNKTPEQG